MNPLYFDAIPFTIEGSIDECSDPSNAISDFIVDYVHNSQGGTVVEYCLIVCFVAIAIAVVLTDLGESVANLKGLLEKWTSDG